MQFNSENNNGAMPLIVVLSISRSKPATVEEEVQIC